MAIHGSQYIIIILTILYKAGAIHRIKWGHVAMKYSDGQTPYPPKKPDLWSYGYTNSDFKWWRWTFVFKILILICSVTHLQDYVYHDIPLHGYHCQSFYTYDSPATVIMSLNHLITWPLQGCYGTLPCNHDDDMVLLHVWLGVAHVC